MGMKNTTWMVYVWAIIVFEAFFLGDDFKRGNDRVCVGKKEMIVRETVDSIKFDQSEEAGWEGTIEVEEDPWSLYNCEKTYNLPSSKEPIEGFERYEREFTYMAGRVQYSLLLDFPGSTIKYGERIWSWLVKESEKALLSYNELYGEEDNVKHKRIYRGNLYDKKAMGQCFANYFFEINHAQYGDSAIDYPILFQDLTMEAVDVTDRFVTYHRRLRNYYGGIHELYTNRLVSYDLVRQEVIDWDYLFLPQYKKSILMLVSEEAMKDEKFLYWEGYRFVNDVEERISFFLEKGSVELKENIHHVGLYKDGVVFSYQPYALSCFAAGDFHFWISCEKLKPYMTKRGKACLGL